MEFDNFLTRIQGTLLSSEQKFGSLVSLKFDDDNTSVIAEVIKKVIEGQSQEDDENILRKLHFYLLLNTNFPIQENLFENHDIAHLVNTAPTLSPDLLVSIVHCCNLHQFACEVITYGESPLSLQYVEALLPYFSKLGTIQLLVQSTNLASAIFLRIIRLCEGFETCNSSNFRYITSKLYELLRSLILGIPAKLADLISPTDTTLLIEISGQVTKHMISLVIKCLEQMENPTVNAWYPQPALEEYDYSQWEEEEVDVLKCLDFIVEECKKNMKIITVKCWLEWDELAGDLEGKSLQVEIGEEAYLCIRKVHSRSTKALADLKGILMGFEIRPKDESDEIQDANLSTILSAIKDDSKTQSTWMEALLKRGDGLNTHAAIETIQEKLHLLTSETTVMLMNRAVTGNSADDALLKQIAFDAFKRSTNQLKILEDFFLEQNLNDLFKTDSFHNEVTFFLNRSAKLRDEPKIQDDQVKKKEWVSELLALCLQSPQELMKRIIVAGVASRGQANLMRAALCEMRLICQLQLGGVDADSSVSLLLHALSHTMTTLNPATSHIDYLVLQLEEEKLLDKVQFIKICLMPALKQDLIDYQVPRIQLWLQLLGKLLKVDSPMSAVNSQQWQGLNLAVILAVLAEVLQRASWVLGKFRQQESLLRADTVTLVRPLACRMANICQADDPDLLWLRAGLLKLTSHNRSHFSPLWTHFGLPVPSMNLGALLLSRDAMCQQSNMPPGGPDQLLSPLLILLPTCCTPEWRLLTSSLSSLLAFHSSLQIDEDDDDVDGESQSEEQMMPKVLRLLVTTMMLQTLMLNQQQPEDPGFSNTSALACLENSVRNLGIIMKEEWLPRLNSLSVVELGTGVVRQVALLLHSLPASISGSCSLTLSGILFQAQDMLLAQAAPHEELATWCSHELALSLALLPDRESRQALARKILLEPTIAQM